MRKNVYVRKYNRFSAWDTSHRPQLTNKRKTDKPNSISANKTNSKQVEDDAGKLTFTSESVLIFKI